MSRRTVFKIAIDCMMTLLLLLLMAYSLVGETLHEWLGAGMLLLFILHHGFNAAWYKSLMRGRYSVYRVVQTVSVVMILVTMLGSMISGIVLSRYVFDFLPISGGRSMVRLVHLPCAYWGFLLMSVHLGLHWNVMMNAIRRMTNCRQSKTYKIILRILALLLAAYGLLRFFHNNFPDYLLMKTQFVFFDFDRPFILFLLDYLAIMGLFVWIGYYGGKGLLIWGKHRRYIK